MTDDLIFMIHRTHDLLKICEDKILSKHGLTSEQYAMLASMKSLNEPVRPTNIAHRLTRSVNNISMMADRMVKAGLLRRRRDRGDRWEVQLSLTSKAEAMFIPATQAIQGFIEEVLSCLTHEDRHTLDAILAKLKEVKP